MRTGKLLPIYENDPNDIKIVYHALQTIDKSRNGSVNEEYLIDVEDCGAAYRFLMALLAVTPGRWLLTGTSRLLERPILPLVNFLNAAGANIRKTDSGWQIDGAELQIDNFEIDISLTSQFASAVMLIRQKPKGRRRESTKARKHEANKKLTHFRSNALTLSCSPYIKMTQTILDKFSPVMLHLADWSTAVFWLANALLKQKAHYLMKDLHFDNLQGDAEIVTWFKKYGLQLIDNENGIEVKHIHNFDISCQKIDVTRTPDIAQILATLAVCYPFELTLFGLKNINLKESHRLDIMVHELSKFTPIIKHSENKITIQKRTKPLPQLFHFDSYNDHRFVMAWLLFQNAGTVNINNKECIKKSYPTFFSIL
jgi:3-phosphoshikimate 1-carboxyvinyltransferase